MPSFLLQAKAVYDWKSRRFLVMRRSCHHKLFTFSIMFLRQKYFWGQTSLFLFSSLSLSSFYSYFSFSLMQDYDQNEDEMWKWDLKRIRSHEHRSHSLEKSSPLPLLLLSLFLYSLSLSSSSHKREVMENDALNRSIDCILGYLWIVWGWCETKKQFLNHQVFLLCGSFKWGVF